MNLHTAFPQLPETVGNYRKLAERLGESPQTGSSRIAHLNYFKQFLDFEHLIVDGRRKHAITIKAILKPEYIQWVPLAQQRVHDATLLICDALQRTKLGNGPNPRAQDIGALVVTTLELIQLLALGNRNVNKWRAGKLAIDIEEEEQVAQHAKYYNYVSGIVTKIVTSQVFLAQFITNRWWTLQDSSAITEGAWRLCTTDEQSTIDGIMRGVLDEMGLKSLAAVFLCRREEAFYANLLTAVREHEQFKDNNLQMLWRTWWFETRADDLELLSNEDLETLRLALGTGVADWAHGSGIDPEIIDVAIAQRQV